MPSTHRIKQGFAILLVAGLYFVAAKLGLMVAFVNSSVTTVWPPSGLALAVLLAFGWPMLIGVALGAFLVNLSTGLPFLIALAIACGNTLQAYVGAWLLAQVTDFRRDLSRLRDLVALIVLGAIVSTLVASTIGTLALVQGQQAPTALAGSVWLTWWAGDAMGVIMIAPLVLAWLARPQWDYSRRRGLELGLLFATLVALNLAAFPNPLSTLSTHLPLAYLLFPPLILIAIRFGLRETALGLAGVAAMTVWYTAQGVGPFARDSLSESLILLHGFLVVLSLTSLPLAARTSEQRQTEARLRLSANAFDSTADGIMITDPNNQMVYVNQAFTRITGYSTAEALGQTPKMLHSGRHDSAFYSAIWRTLDERGHWQGEIWNRRKSGEIYPEWLSISAVPDERGQRSNYVGVFTDISQHKQTQDRLDFLANHDALTSLANRIAFHELAHEALLRAHRSGRIVALLFIDLDNFKTINDTLGHPMGDSLIQAVAQRLSESLRESDVVARLGGDEFTVLMENLVEGQDAAILAQKILAVLEHPFNLADQTLYISASIGISIYPGDGSEAETLLKNADMAMYRAKADGRNAYRFFSTDLNAQAVEAMRLTNALRTALLNGEFFLNYQPRLALPSAQVVGVEALLRWRHPVLGLVSPAKFIPLAEQAGLIEHIGEWVLQTACRQAREWQAAGLAPFRMAVNLSARQLRQPDLVARIRAALEAHALEPRWLELEITESLMVQNPEHTERILRELKTMGVRIAVDDFGTGYSSLSYLKRFSLDYLKIDQSFIRDIPHDPDNMAIARAVIALATSLKLQVVGEGVETEAQRAFLAAEGCHEVQGFFYCKPLPAEELVAYIHQRTLQAQIAG